MSLESPLECSKWGRFATGRSFNNIGAELGKKTHRPDELSLQFRTRRRTLSRDRLHFSLQEEKFCLVTTLQYIVTNPVKVYSLTRRAALELCQIVQIILPIKTGLLKRLNDERRSVC